MAPYIRKIQQEFDEAQMFLLKNGFHKATKGLLQEIENANGMDKQNNIQHTLGSKTTKSLGSKSK